MFFYAQATVLAGIALLGGAVNADSASDSSALLSSAFAVPACQSAVRTPNGNDPVILSCYCDGWQRALT
jgi:hypothetical protein